MPLNRSKPTPAQCKATTSSGARCKAKPHKDGLCFFHSDPKKAAELGRKGGRHNRQEPPGEGSEVGRALPHEARPALCRLQRLVRPQRAH